MRAQAGPPKREDILSRFARLAARVAGTPCAFIGVDDGAATIAASYGVGTLADTAWFDALREEGTGPLMVLEDLSQGPFSHHALVTGPPYLRFMLQLPVRNEAGQPGGFMCVADTGPRSGLEPAQLASLRDMAGLLGEALEWERRHVGLLQLTSRAVWADRMLQQVSDAESCTDALTSMLSEMCRYHGALVGRIWRLTDDGVMQEVSRFASDTVNQHEYYRAQPTTPVRAGNSMTAEAIRLNEPRAFFYSSIHNVDQYALMGAAVAAGLASQVSFPIWVQEQRFGISLAFTTEREDLGAIVTDIASLASSIRPALFRKVTEERIRYMAHHDELTQLGNRTVLNERLAAAMERPQEPGGAGLALLYLDLDGFKRVNDSRGHEVGDKLLAAVAGRLRATVDAGATIARIGGDEFAIVHPAAEQPQAAAQLARRLLAAVAQPFDIDGQPAAVGVSIGIALHPADGETPDVLQRHADAALYEAKQHGRNTFRVFQKSVGIVQRDRSELERSLRQAIEHDRLTLAYQPIVSVETRRVQGMEALLRWRHPTRGELRAPQFVPMAEASGLAGQLGRWVLQAACTEAARWVRPVMLSVNVSPLQLRQPGLPGDVEAVLASTGLPADRLELEITDGLLLDDVALGTLHAVREQGVRVSLDSFGEGCAGLGYLRRFPFDRVHVGMDFVHGITSDEGTAAIVETLITLSRRLGIEVVGEAVETEEQLAALRRLGCGLVQGYLTGAPLERDAAMALLRQEHLTVDVGG